MNAATVHLCVKHFQLLALVTSFNPPITLWGKESVGSSLLISFQCALFWQGTWTSQLGLGQAGELEKPQDPQPRTHLFPAPGSCSLCVCQLGLGALQMPAGEAGIGFAWCQGRLERGFTSRLWLEQDHSPDYSQQRKCYL